MGNTWTDPQFYVVTAVAAWGVWAVLKPLVSSGKDPEAGCPSCTTCSKPPFGDAAGRAPESTSDSASLVVLGGSPRPRAR